MASYTLDDATTTNDAGSRLDPGLSGPEMPTDTRDWGRDAPVRQGPEAATDTVDWATDGPNGLGVEETPHTPAVGVVIPGAFYRVRVRCVDESGEPLGSVKWVMSAGTFPTAAPVDNDGYANLWLLGTTYTTFMAVADSGGVDLTWYSSTDAQQAVNPLDDDAAEVVLSERYIGGLNASGGVSLGL